MNFELNKYIERKLKENPENLINGILFKSNNPRKTKIFVVEKRIAKIDFKSGPKNLNPASAFENESPEEEINNSEDEGIEDYKQGGYHPVFVGEVLIDRYVI